MSEKTSSLIIQRLGDVRIIEFINTRMVDQVQIDTIARELTELIEKAGVPKLVISFDNVTHVSSAMIGVLIKANQQAKAKSKKGGVRLAALPKDIADVFKLMKLDKLMKVYKDGDQAALKW
ncbi:MAG: STAS domain-containing protein [Phycisphaerae bacterium]|nr:STAS domain-containing protein [Phycisphaerae bacterium]